MRVPFTLGIRSVVVAVCTLTALVSGAILVVAAAGVSREVLERESAGTLRALGQEVGDQLARGLHVQWRELEGLRRIAQQARSPEDLRLRFETITSLNERYIWLGLARPDGQVMVAANRLLEGEDVSERAWFRAGLQGPFGGDVRSAVLLQQIIAPTSREPLRLIDFAAPVRRPDGTLVGVIGSHVGWTAVRDLMRDALSGGERDVMLVSRTGTILIGPPDLEGTAPTVPSLLALRQGAARTQIETWPNGESYLTAVVTPIAYRDLPSFGWSLVVRQRAEAAAAPAQAITRRLGFALGLAGLVALAGSVVLGSVIARPLRRLGLSAEAIAEGRFGDPVPDMRGVVEIRTIADGLMRVQSRLMESEPPGPPPPAARRRDEAEETAR